MASPVPSTDSDTLTIGPASESKDQVTELLLPPADQSAVPGSPSVSHQKRDSADSGQDTRRESTTSSTDDATRRTSVVSNADKESDPPSSGHVTQEQSRNTSIDQGDQSSKTVPPLVKEDSEESSSSSDPSSPISEPSSSLPTTTDPKSYDTPTSTVFMSESESGALLSSDISIGGVEFSDSDPGRSVELPPDYTPIVTPEESSDNKSDVLFVVCEKEMEGLQPPNPNPPSPPGPPRSVSRNAEPISDPAVEIPIVLTPPQPVNGSLHDLVFTLSKNFCYVCGLLYLTGLYCDLWFHVVPHAFDSPFTASSYMVSLVSFGFFCLIDSTRIHWAWLTIPFIFTVILNGYFIVDFRAFHRWWFGFSVVHIVCMFTYGLCLKIDNDPLDMLRAYVKYLLDKKNYELMPRIQVTGDMTTSEQIAAIAAEEGFSLGPVVTVDDSPEYRPSPFNIQSDSSIDVPVLTHVLEAQIHPHDPTTTATNSESDKL